MHIAIYLRAARFPHTLTLSISIEETGWSCNQTFNGQTVERIHFRYSLTVGSGYEISDLLLADCGNSDYLK